MAYQYSVKILALPKLPNAYGNFASGWARVHEKNRWIRLIMGHFMGAKPAEPLQRAKITLTRHSTQEPDVDNLAASWKPVLDAIVRNMVLIDDAPEHLELVSRWEKATKRIDQGITVVVEGA